MGSAKVFKHRALEIKQRQKREKRMERRRLKKIRPVGQ